MDYSSLLAFLVVALLFGAGGLGVNRLLSPHKPGPVKNAIYECGNEPTGDAQIRYNVRFYIFALLLATLLGVTVLGILPGPVMRALLDLSHRLLASAPAL